MFIIPARIEYGLNLLIFLAENFGQPPIPLNKIAAAAHMPYRFLTQVARPLARAGFVAVKEGKSGGYTLSIPPEKIQIKSVFDSLGEPFKLAKCFHHGYICAGRKNCKMKIIWLRIKKSIDRELSALTLKNLI